MGWNKSCFVSKLWVMLNNCWNFFLSVILDIKVKFVLLDKYLLYVFKYMYIYIYMIVLKFWNI